MKALRFDGTLRLTNNAPVPRREGEALVEVLLAGICNTDLEIVKGYAGFYGTLGHEFVGRVVESPEDSLLGRRVVGEINIGCNVCAVCRAGDWRHCAARTVLGIKNRDGAFAQYLSLPVRNLLEVPDSISDEAAVLIEPLAAACQILQQVAINSSSRVAVVGDGKLAQLILRALAVTGCALTVIGKHQYKLDLAKQAGARCLNIGAGERAETDSAGAFSALAQDDKYDFVIEASGSPSGLQLALDLVRPRGTIVLKSTHHQATRLEMSRIVVEEITIVGSRCGRFPPAIDLLASEEVDVRPLIQERFSIEEGVQAFTKASAPGMLKVLIQPAEI